MNLEPEPETNILDDTFHGAAFTAYVELAIASGGVPEEAATRRKACQLYEEALAERHSVRDSGKPS